MKIVVHDYSGHPGQVHLSRELARRGHRVEHQYCDSYSTGRGAIERREGDPGSFDVRAISLGREFARYTPLLRITQEIQYGFAAAKAVLEAHPDVVVLSNVPLVSLVISTCVLRLRKVPYIFWQQDVYSHAINTVLRERLGKLGALVGRVATLLERAVARHAYAVIAISRTFVTVLSAWGIPLGRIHIIPNWAPIDEMPVHPKDNSWARKQRLTNSRVVMYAGTLGIKHDPSLLAALACSAPPDTTVVVVSEGRGRDWLEANAADVTSLELLDYQPYGELPEMLASADVLVVILEQDASQYSVPSKVLNYLCAGRPILALLPADNGVAHSVLEANAGVVIDPADREGAIAAMTELLSDPAQRERMGVAARIYAETTFDVKLVGDKVEALLRGVRGGGDTAVADSAQ